MGNATVIRQYVDAIRHQPDARLAAAARTAWQLARARLLYGIGPRYFSAFRLGDQPESAWPDYVIEFSEFKRRLAALSPRAVHEIADDKVRFYLFCRDHGVATIPIECLVLPSGAVRHPRLPTVTGVEEWRAAVARARGRLFLKPVDGVWGEGAFVLTPTSDGCEFGGRAGSIEDAFRYIDARLDGTGGYVVQPCIESHPAIRAVSAAAGLATVRMVTCRQGGAVRLLYAVMKLTAGDNVTDNFHHGRNGNLIAPVELQSGQLGIAVGAVRTDWPVMADFARHPGTGNLIQGFCIPHWQEAVGLVTTAHQSLPELRITGWDVAIAQDGPLIVETNPRFGFDILQIAHRRGIRREVMQAIGSS